MDWWISKSKKQNNKTTAIPISLFMPNDRDTDGLSVSQKSLTTVEAARKTAKGKDGCLAEFPTEIIEVRGLTLIHKPTEQDPGHSVIPEMNTATRDEPATANIVKEHALALSEASRVVWPTS